MAIFTDFVEQKEQSLNAFDSLIVVIAGSEIIECGFKNFDWILLGFWLCYGCVKFLEIWFKVGFDLFQSCIDALPEGLECIDGLGFVWLDNFEEGLSVGGVLRVLRRSGSFGFEKLSDREKGFEFLFGMTFMIVLVALLAAETILATGFHETDELELLSLFSMRAGAFQIGGFSHD
jgi:hypothetical protein